MSCIYKSLRIISMLEVSHKALTLLLFFSVCNFVVHDRCLKNVVSPCSSIAANLVKVSVGVARAMKGGLCGSVGQLGGWRGALCGPVGQLG